MDASAEFLSTFAVVCVCVATIGVGSVAALATWLLSSNRTSKISATDKLVIMWLVYNTLTHFVLEGSFLYHSLTVSVENATGILAEVWKEYAKADIRWGRAHPTIVSLEILTVFFNGSLCILLIRAILTEAPHRHFVQIVLNVCELYGGWMTFCPEWLTGSASLDTSNWLYLWVYLVFFNGIWVVIPLLLLAQSFVASTAQNSSKKKQT